MRTFCRENRQLSRAYAYDSARSGRGTILLFCFIGSPVTINTRGRLSGTTMSSGADREQNQRFRNTIRVYVYGNGTRRYKIQKKKLFYRRFGVTHGRFLWSQTKSVYIFIRVWPAEGSNDRSAPVPE